MPNFFGAYWYVKFTLHSCTCLLVITSALVLSDAISPAWLLVALFLCLIVALMLVAKLCGIKFLMARMKNFASWGRSGL
ncbi:TPA: hypothetical protein RQN23_000677 [Aeromonas veronii]|nr:hypothetical protein [Aeromonas veronii]